MSQSQSNDPIANWNALFAANLTKCNGDRKRAMSLTVSENPDAHKAYLTAYNAQRGRSGR